MGQDDGQSQSCLKGKNVGTILHESWNSVTSLVLFQASKKLDEKSKSDVLELLGHLEGELQAKEIAIATLKVSKRSCFIVFLGVV